MIEMKIHLTPDQLMEMDRMIQGHEVQGRQWLRDAVAIYKQLLLARRRRLDGLRHLRIVEGGCSPREAGAG